MDIQVVLIIILSLLTINLIVVGIYVVLVLKEVRDSIRTANGILSDFESVTDTLSNPVSLISGLLSSIAGGYKAVNSIRSLKEDE